MGFTHKVKIFEIIIKKIEVMKLSLFLLVLKLKIKNSQNYFKFYLKNDILFLEVIMNTLKPKPFVKWAGGKRQILDKLKKYVPNEFNTYYEPFVGGGALLF